MTEATHLNEDDYPKAFPPVLDTFPAVTDEEHYIDAWLLNTVFNSLLATEQYLIDWKQNIEAPIGEDVIGDDGQLEISIPSARYTGYETALAWDSNLLEENIKVGETIFGVTGTLAAIAGAIIIAVPAVTAIADAWVYRAPPTLDMTTSAPIIAVPAVSAA